MNPKKLPGKVLRQLRRKANLQQKDIAEVLGVSPSAVSKYETGKLLLDLESIQKLAKFFDVPITTFFQSTEVSKVLRTAKEIPLYIAPASAGNGSFPDSVEVERMIPVTYPNADFAVQVRGDSMEPTVPDKAIVIVQKQSNPQDGDMIVCTYDGWVYVKWYHVVNDRVYLVSDNSAYPPILVEPHELFVIHGVVIDIMRGDKPRKKFK